MNKRAKSSQTRDRSLYLWKDSISSTEYRRSWLHRLLLLCLHRFRLVSRWRVEGTPIELVKQAQSKCDISPLTIHLYQIILIKKVNLIIVPVISVDRQNRLRRQRWQLRLKIPFLWYTWQLIDDSSRLTSSQAPNPHKDSWRTSKEESEEISLMFF